MRLRSGSATTGDLDEFKRWAGQSRAHAQSFAEARRFWEALAPAGRNVMARGDASVLVGDRAAPQGRIGRRAFLGGALGASAVAASYAIVHPPLNLWPALPELLRADYRTSTGEQRQLRLADNVSIEMNTRTSIAVADEHRIELISGEGAIVSGSQLFEVAAGKGSARCSNATFCIRRDGGTVRVTCLDGQVHVACGETATVLAARQQIRYSDAGLGQAVAIDPETVAAWRTGNLVFHDTPLGDVVAEANRYRGGRIVVANEALGRRLVNARFRLDQIDDLVPKLTNAFGATAMSLPGGIVILS